MWVALQLETATAECADADLPKSCRTNGRGPARTGLPLASRVWIRKQHSTPASASARSVGIWSTDCAAQIALPTAAAVALSVGLPCAAETPPFRDGGVVAAALTSGSARRSELIGAGLAAEPFSSLAMLGGCAARAAVWTLRAAAASPTCETAPLIVCDAAVRAFPPELAAFCAPVGAETFAKCVTGSAVADLGRELAREESTTATRLGVVALGGLPRCVTSWCLDEVGAASVVAGRLTASAGGGCCGVRNCSLAIRTRFLSSEPGASPAMLLAGFGLAGLPASASKDPAPVLLPALTDPFGCAASAGLAERSPRPGDSDTRVFCASALSDTTGRPSLLGHSATSVARVQASVVGATRNGDWIRTTAAPPMVRGPESVQRDRGAPA